MSLDVAAIDRKLVINPERIVPAEALAHLCARHAVRELAVFGSALTERFTADSDVDLLVEFQPDARVGLLKLGQLQRELALLLRRRVDLVPKSGLKPLIRERVLASAQTIYAA